MSYFRKHLLFFGRIISYHGIRAAMADSFHKFLKKISYKKFYYQILEGYQYPICLRFDTSDKGVYEQVFINQDYSPVLDIINPKFIVDCGANAGFFSIYFLNKFPLARVAAVEPDSENFHLCQVNLLKYGDRVSLYQAGIWSHDAKLKVIKGQYRFGGEDSVQVRECSGDEKEEIHGIDISTILKNSSFDSIDLLKIDIEGSEAVVFLEICHQWLAKVKNIAIELHDKECERIFFQAMSKYRYDLFQKGELTFCKNIRAL